MKHKAPWKIIRPAAWITIILLIHLLVFSLRGSAVLAAPGAAIRVDNMNENQLFKQAFDAVAAAKLGHEKQYKPPNNHQTKWSDAAIYLSAFLGRISVNEGGVQEARTYQSNLDEIEKYLDELILLGTDYQRYETIIVPCLSKAGVPNVRSSTTNVKAPSLLPTRAPAPSAQTRAPGLLFSEEFNGPPLNKVFQSGLPDAVFRPNNNAFASYEGAPSYSFETWSGGAKYLRLNNSLNNTQRKGWRTSEAYNPGDRAFRLELRFNPRTQASDKGIDQLLEVWLIDANSQHKHIRVTVFSDGYGANRLFAYTNTLISKGEERGFGFEDNKWYRLVITGSPNENIKAAILDDAGTRELVSLITGSRSNAFPNGFRLGLSQSVGYPGGRYPTDVAIDWIRLTAE